VEYVRPLLTAAGVSYPPGVETTKVFRIMSRDQPSQCIQLDPSPEGSNITVSDSKATRNEARFSDEEWMLDPIGKVSGLVQRQGLFMVRMVRNPSLCLQHKDGTLQALEIQGKWYPPQLWAFSDEGLLYAVVSSICYCVCFCVFIRWFY
jgi:hypothetical protein